VRAGRQQQTAGLDIAKWQIPDDNFVYVRLNQTGWRNESKVQLEIANRHLAIVPNSTFMNDKSFLVAE
jgi:hypothetical protein